MCSASNSPESGLGTSHTSLPGIDSDADQPDGDEGEYCEAEQLPPLGTCRALYPFDGTLQSFFHFGSGSSMSEILPFV